MPTIQEQINQGCREAEYYNRKNLVARIKATVMELKELTDELDDSLISESVNMIKLAIKFAEVK